MDFARSMNPKRSRYHLEDYGSHDIICDHDILYQAILCGVRIVACRDC